MPNALATRNSVDPKKSGLHTCRSICSTLAFRARATRVLTLKNSVPGKWVIAASQLRSCGSQRHILTGFGRVLMGFVDVGHRRGLSLQELQERRCGEEYRADEIGDAVRNSADRIDVGR